MKKLLKVLISFFALCCMFPLFNACKKTCNNPKAHDKIAANYAKAYDVDKEYVRCKCFGNFNGTHVLIIDGAWGYASVITSESVDGVVFYHTCSRTFEVYNNGKFYSLQKAFDNGLLTHKNLLTVLENHKAEYDFLYE